MSGQAPQETITSLVENNDGTYTNEANDQTNITIEETISTLLNNNDGSYTYTNEIGGETNFNSGSGEGHSGQEGSVFFAGVDGTPTENNQQFFWDDSSQKLGVGNSTPTSTLHSSRSLATNIRFSGGSITLSDLDHTLIINGNTNITLPSADQYIGRMYILKKAPSAAVDISPFLNTDGTQVFSLSQNVTWLQSDGFDWQQIN